MGGSQPKGKNVKSGMMRTGHMEGMEEGQLPKGAEGLKHPGCRERGRLQLRWEDCVKRDVIKTEEDDLTPL